LRVLRIFAAIETGLAAIRRKSRKRVERGSSPFTRLKRASSSGSFIRDWMGFILRPVMAVTCLGPGSGLIGRHGLPFEIGGGAGI